MIRRWLAPRRRLALEDIATGAAAIAAELRLLRQALDAGALRGFKADLDSMIRALPADGVNGGEGSGSPSSPPVERFTDPADLLRGWCAAGPGGPPPPPGPVFSFQP